MTEAVPAADLAVAALALARRFAAGATLWCVAPQWPDHARHVAVEFVHPVVVGTRALPAVAVDRPEDLDAVRASVRGGDALIAIAPAADAVVSDLARRAPAWGVETFWVGGGPRPRAGAADHVLWCADDDPLLAHSSRFVVAYHVLWEMTHVCFETIPAPACREDVCITCSDEGRLAEVLTADDHGVAMVRTADGEEGVDVSLVTPVESGDLVLVHAGTALTRVESEGVDS
jgi:hydrogenase maturation factor